MKRGECLFLSWRGVSLVAFLAVGLLLLSCAPLFAQGSAGTIVGTVTDAKGGAIAGAAVTVLDVNRGTSRPLTTDESGAYSAPNLVPGAYKVRAEFKGFKATERANIALEVGQELRVDLTLQTGDVSQTITVTEEIPLVETTNAELGGTLQNEVINDLPLNGRNFENLLDLRPGVEKYVGNSGWTQSANGLRPHDNFFMVEGVNSNDPWMAQSMMNAVMAAGDAGTMLPIDAIDEFKTQQNPRAEYGWKPGAVVNVGVKSGTNTIHGSAYAYGRDQSFDARNFFEVDTNPKVPLSLEQYGASIGGAIKKDKLFYFANFEKQHYSVGNPFDHTVPATSPTATGNRSLVGACQTALDAGAPGSGAPGALTTLSATLAGITVGPAAPGHANGTCVMGSTPGVFPVSPTGDLPSALDSLNTIYSGVAKIDFHMNDKNTFSGMYFISPGDGTFVDDPAHQVLPQWLTVQHARSQVGTVGWAFVPNSKWVNSARFGYSHYYQTFLSADSNVNPTTYGINTGVVDPHSFGFPRIRIQGGFSAFQLGASWPKTVGPDAVIQFSDSISYLRGNHAFKFGGEVLINQSTNEVTSNTKGPITFGNLVNFFSGTIKSANITVGNFLRHMQNEGYGLFAQDDWRVTPRLTVNLGVRYELNTVLKERDNKIGNFDPVKGLIQDGVGGVSGVYNGDHNNFSPRVGFAWDVAGNGKTVVRGGAGILYEQGSFDYLNALGNLLGLRTVPTGVNIYLNNISTPTTAGGTINLGAVSYSKPAALAPLDANWANNANQPLYSAAPACGDGSFTQANGIKALPCDVLGVDRNLRTPYVATWSLGIQRAITNSLSIDVSYVGNHGTKLVGLGDLNQPPVGSGWGDPTAGTGTGVNATGSPAYVCLNDFVTNGGPYTNCSPGQGPQPYASKFPYLGYIYWLSNNNFSNYNSLQVSATQRTTHGLSFVMGYTFSHALAESPDNWSFISPVNSANPREIYGTSEFDARHKFTFSTTYEIPGINAPAQLLKGWSLNSIITLESSYPWGINDITTDFSGTNEINSQSPNGEQWDFFGNPADFKTTKALINTNLADPTNPASVQGGLPYFAGTSNSTCLAHSTAMGQLALASLTDLGCYASLNGNSVLVPPPYGSLGTTAPNMFRSFPYYNVDLSVTKVFKVKERLSFQFRAEFFNIFNRPNIANVFGGPGGDNTDTDPSADAGVLFGFRNTTPDVLSSNPVLGSGGPRAMQLGLKILF